MTVWHSARISSPAVYVLAGLLVTALHGCSAGSNDEEKGGQRTNTLNAGQTQGLTKIKGTGGFLPSSKSQPISDKYLTFTWEKENNYFKTLSQQPNLMENQKDSGKTKMLMMPSGLQYVDIEPGWGMSPESGGMTYVHYTGWLENGTKIDSSLDKNIPFQFRFGKNEVLVGLEEGISNMKVGGIRKLIIPPQLGYGAKGLPNKIPPNATLVYKIRLLSVGKAL